jgi:hypothetical protein
MMKKREALAKLEIAKRDLSVAEADLLRVLGDIQTAPRAEKTAITEIVSDAFAKVKAARAILGDLEALVSEDDG